jgi:hypothetical protein
MFMGLLFAASLVILLRFMRPEQLLTVESLPDVTAFFATLQSPITPLLPSFWAGETLFVGGFVKLRRCEGPVGQAGFGRYQDNSHRKLARLL